jgi:hypothetical protein
MKVQNFITSIPLFLVIFYSIYDSLLLWGPFSIIYTFMLQHPSFYIILICEYDTPTMYACALYFSNPDSATRTFFSVLFIFAPSSPRHYFFASHCHSLYSTTTNQRTNERTNEQTNGRTVTPLFSHHVHLLLAITNFLPFASLLFLLTLDRLQ